MALSYGSPAHLGEAIRARREELRLSPHALAQRSGLPLPTVTALETDAGSHSLDELFAALAALDLTLALQPVG
jgi:transcriptional regulator with XRE-family HTH domain